MQTEHGVQRLCGVKKSRALVVQLTVVAFGWLLAIAVGVVLYRNALHDKDQEFRLRCINRRQVIKAEMANNLNTSFVVIGLLSAVPNLTMSDWQAFTKHSQFLRPNMRRVFYMERVLARDRDAFEQRWNGTMMGFGANLDLEVRSMDSEYAPITFVTDEIENMSLVDPTSIPVIKTAVERGRDTGNMSMSAPDTYRGIWRMGVYLPFYGQVLEPWSLPTVEERRQACLGYIGVSVDIYDLFSVVLSRFNYDVHMELAAAYVPKRLEDYLPSHECSPDHPGCDVLIYGDPSRQGQEATATISWHFAFQTFHLKCFAKYNIELFALRSTIAWPLVMMVVILLSSIIVFLVMKRLQAVEGDVTVMEKLNEELKVAKQAAEAADKAKSNFLATVSHEIRTPMNGMIGMTNLLLGTDLTQQQLEYVKIAQQSGNALIALINDVLDLSKIEAGGTELESVSFDVRLEIDDVLSLFEDKVQQKEIEVSALVHDSVPDCVIGDPGRLRQVLINLVGNAMKFTKKGSIFVCVRLVDESRQSTVNEISAEDTSVSSSTSVVSDVFSLSHKSDSPPSPPLLNVSHDEEASPKSISAKCMWTVVNSTEADNVPPRLSMQQTSLNLEESVKKWRSWLPRPTSDSDEELQKLVLVISVEDTGIGIPLHLQHRLFEPFIQANSGTAREYGGTGIGLSISQKLVTLMNGKLTVESQPGKGSTFEFTLTLFKGGDSILTPSHQSEAEQDKLRGVKVLLLDSHLVRQEVVSTYLRRLGVLVEACEDAKLAESLLTRQNKPVFQAAVVDFEELETETAQSFAKSMEKAEFTCTLYKPLRHTSLAAALLQVLQLKSQFPLKTINPHERMLLDKRVLVVDDNLINRKVASSMLERYGALVVSVTGGSQALDALKKEAAFDLILMDIQMPEMDGYEATRQIRRLEIDACSECRNLTGGRLSARYNQESDDKTRVTMCPHHKIPVVAVTADVMNGTNELCLNAGMDDYIPKPLDQRQLHSLLERFLKNDLVNRRGLSVQGGRNAYGPGQGRPNTSASQETVIVIQYP